MIETLTTEMRGLALEIFMAAIVGFLEIARRQFAAWAARTAVIGAVERAAGLALEIERAGGTTVAALNDAKTYVEQAVPQALATTGAAPHLDLMVEGAMGVLRSRIAR